MIEFQLLGEFIHLIQLLKATDAVSSGGEAQMVVSQGLVTYNGITDYRKRLKVKKGDIITYNKQSIKII